MAISKSKFNNQTQPVPLQEIPGPKTHIPHVSNHLYENEFDMHHHGPRKSPSRLYDTYEDALDAIRDKKLYPGETHTEFYTVDNEIHCIIGIGNFREDEHKEYSDNWPLILTDMGDISLIDQFKNIEDNFSKNDIRFERFEKQILNEIQQVINNIQGLSNDLDIFKYDVNNLFKTLKKEFQSEINSARTLSEDLVDTLRKEVKQSQLEQDNRLNHTDDELYRLKQSINELLKKLQSLEELVSVNETTLISDPSIDSLFKDVYTVNLCCYTEGGWIEVPEYNTYTDKVLQTITMVAHANEGYRFKWWVKDANTINVNTNTSIVVDFANGDINVIGTLLNGFERDMLKHGYTAVFQKMDYKYVQTIAEPEEGGIVFGGDTKILLGDIIELEARPNEDYMFEKWVKITNGEELRLESTIDANGYGYAHDMVTTSCSYKAYFINEKKVTIKFVDGNSIISTLNYLIGQLVEYVGTTPTKADTYDASRDIWTKHVFNGWNEELGIAEIDKTYSAVWIDSEYRLIDDEIYDVDEKLNNNVKFQFQDNKLFSTAVKASADKLNLLSAAGMDNPLANVTDEEIQNLIEAYIPANFKIDTDLINDYNLIGISLGYIFQLIRDVIKGLDNSETYDSLYLMIDQLLNKFILQNDNAINDNEYKQLLLSGKLVQLIILIIKDIVTTYKEKGTINQVVNHSGNYEETIKANKLIQRIISSVITPTIKDIYDFIDNDEIVQPMIKSLLAQICYMPIIVGNFANLYNYGYSELTYTEEELDSLQYSDIEINDLIEERNRNEERANNGEITWEDYNEHNIAINLQLQDIVRTRYRNGAKSSTKRKLFHPETSDINYEKYLYCNIYEYARIVNETTIGGKPKFNIIKFVENTTNEYDEELQCWIDNTTISLLKTTKQITITEADKFNANFIELLKPYNILSDSITEDSNDTDIMLNLFAQSMFVKEDVTFISTDIFKLEGINDNIIGIALEIVYLISLINDNPKYIPEACKRADFGDIDAIYDNLAQISALKEIVENHTFDEHWTYLQSQLTGNIDTLFDNTELLPFNNDILNYYLDDVTWYKNVMQYNNILSQTDIRISENCLIFDLNNNICSLSENNLKEINYNNDYENYGYNKSCIIYNIFENIYYNPSTDIFLEYLKSKTLNTNYAFKLSKQPYFSISTNSQHYIIELDDIESNDECAIKIGLLSENNSNYIICNEQSNQILFIAEVSINTNSQFYKQYISYKEDSYNTTQILLINSISLNNGTLIGSIPTADLVFQCGNALIRINLSTNLITIVDAQRLIYNTLQTLPVTAVSLIKQDISGMLNEIDTNWTFLFDIIGLFATIFSQDASIILTLRSEINSAITLIDKYIGPYILVIKLMLNSMFGVYHASLIKNYQPDNTNLEYFVVGIDGKKSNIENILNNLLRTSNSFVGYDILEYFMSNILDKNNDLIFYTLDSQYEISVEELLNEQYMSTILDLMYSNCIYYSPNKSKDIFTDIQRVFSAGSSYKFSDDFYNLNDNRLITSADNGKTWSVRRSNSSEIYTISVLATKVITTHDFATLCKITQSKNEYYVIFAGKVLLWDEDTNNYKVTVNFPGGLSKDGQSLQIVYTIENNSKLTIEENNGIIFLEDLATAMEYYNDESQEYSNTDAMIEFEAVDNDNSDSQENQFAAILSLLLGNFGINQYALMLLLQNTLNEYGDDLSQYIQTYGDDITSDTTVYYLRIDNATADLYFGKSKLQNLTNNKKNIITDYIKFDINDIFSLPIIHLYETNETKQNSSLYTYDYNRYPDKVINSNIEVYTNDKTIPKLVCNNINNDLQKTYVNVDKLSIQTKYNDSSNETFTAVITDDFDNTAEVLTNIYGLYYSYNIVKKNQINGEVIEEPVGTFINNVSLNDMLTNSNDEYVIYPMVEGDLTFQRLYDRISLPSFDINGISDTAVQVLFYANTAFKLLLSRKDNYSILYYVKVDNILYNINTLLADYNTKLSIDINDINAKFQSCWPDLYDKYLLTLTDIKIGDSYYDLSETYNIDIMTDIMILFNTEPRVGKTKIVYYNFNDHQIRKTVVDVIPEDEEEVKSPRQLGVVVPQRYNFILYLDEMKNPVNTIDDSKEIWQLTALLDDATDIDLYKYIKYSTSSPNVYPLAHLEYEEANLPITDDISKYDSTITYNKENDASEQVTEILLWAEDEQFTLSGANYKKLVKFDQRGNDYVEDVIGELPVGDTFNMLPQTVHELSYLSCVKFDTSILMADGSYKLIKDIRVGDKVIGRNNIINTVYYGPIRQEGYGMPGYIRYTFNDGKFLDVVGDHRIYNELTNEFEYISKITGLETNYIEEPLIAYELYTTGDNTYYANGILCGKAWSNWPTPIRNLTNKLYKSLYLNNNNRAIKQTHKLLSKYILKHKSPIINEYI